VEFAIDFVIFIVNAKIPRQLCISTTSRSILKKEIIFWSFNELVLSVRIRLSGIICVLSKTLNPAIVGVCAALAYIMRCVVFVCDSRAATLHIVDSRALWYWREVWSYPILICRGLRDHMLPLGIVLTSYTILYRPLLLGAKCIALYFGVMLHDNNQTFDYPTAKLRSRGKDRYNWQVFKENDRLARSFRN